MENRSLNRSCTNATQAFDISPAGLTLYRKRLIPAECIALPDDDILFCENGILVTSWKTIRPRNNFDHGFSCYYLKEGYKISKFYRADNTLLYYYCDIISSAYEKNTNTLTITDLLADVIVYPDGFVKVVDLDELSDVLEKGRLSIKTLVCALRILNRLLEQLYAGKLDKLLEPINRYDTLR